jgi:hypothetical protein
MKWKYIIPVLLIAMGTQIVSGQETDHYLSSPAISTNKQQSQNNISLITANKNSIEGSGATGNTTLQQVTELIPYQTPVDPANRTINTSYLVGATKGAFDVNPAGGASYTIPIDVLPGANGLAPSLSLVYSSNSGSGVAGYGWQIGGLSVISRSPQNYYNDTMPKDRFTGYPIRILPEVVSSGSIFMGMTIMDGPLVLTEIPGEELLIPIIMPQLTKPHRARLPRRPMGLMVR